MSEQPSATEQNTEAGADVPEDVPQSENDDERGSNESWESPRRSRKDVTICMHVLDPNSQLSSSAMQKRKVQHMMLRTSSKWHACEERASRLRRPRST